jgi:two-component system capsular synthesis response regulator RcsB
MVGNVPVQAHIAGGYQQMESVSVDPGSPVRFGPFLYLYGLRFCRIGIGRRSRGLSLSRSRVHPRIIIADDHPVVLHGIRIVLQTHLMEVVGSARDGAQLLQLVDHHDCDAVLTDLSMPGTGPDGPELIARCARHPACRWWC